MTGVFVSRRLLLGGAAGIALARPSLALAQGKGPGGWPNGRSVAMTIPFTAGGATDVVSRILQESFAETLGGTYVMDHKPGGTTTIGLRAVARARPDGTTLLVGSNSGFCQAPYAYKTLGYDPLKDFTPISLLYGSAYMLVAHPRWRSFEEVVAAAKRSPGKLSYATWGVGSTAHLLMLDTAERAGMDMLHVPYAGAAPALTEILAGRLDMMFTTFAAARAHVLEGRLRALTVPHEERLAAIPTVPTTVELGLPEVLVSAWWGLAAPAGLPAPLTAALDQAVRTAAATPLAARFSDEFGLLPLPMGPEAMLDRIHHDLALNAVLMRKAGIVPE